MKFFVTCLVPGTKSKHQKVSFVNSNKISYHRLASDVCRSSIDFFHWFLLRDCLNYTPVCGCGNSWELSSRASWLMQRVFFTVVKQINIPVKTFLFEIILSFKVKLSHEISINFQNQKRFILVLIISNSA